MNEEVKEKMLDLICKQAMYGLNEQELQELERYEFEVAESESIDLTVATLSLIDLDTTQEMPAHLQSRILASAENFFAEEKAREGSPAPVGEVVSTDSKGSTPWFGWLGWAAAAAACIALAVVIFIPRNQQPPIVAGPTPSPTVSAAPDPAREREQLIESSGQVLTAQFGKGNVKEVENVSGDVVWSDEKQAGYLRLRGLPRNDVSKETYQLWIIAENHNPKTPVDGGTFNVNAEGEVIIPIDAKLKVINPQAFAVTIEKPDGVVVSTQERVAALAKPET